MPVFEQMRELRVALHPEGVDRNNFLDYNVRRMGVALHPEGVDRNDGQTNGDVRALVVALHPEGVDRNHAHRPAVLYNISRPPPGGRG